MVVIIVIKKKNVGYIYFINYVREKLSYNGMN